MGFQDADFDKPLVGLASAHSTVTPCNMSLGPLAERADAALREAGVMPELFGTITVSDGISMGTEGMKYSLVSREIIADSIEAVCNSQAMDGVLAIGACDKNLPGAMMAFARLEDSVPHLEGVLGREPVLAGLASPRGELAPGVVDAHDVEPAQDPDEAASV